MCFGSDSGSSAGAESRTPPPPPVAPIVPIPNEPPTAPLSANADATDTAAPKKATNPGLAIPM